MSVEDNLILGAFDRYRTGHRDHMETMDEVSNSSRASKNAATSWPARFPAVSARCWRWAAH